MAVLRTVDIRSVVIPCHCRLILYDESPGGVPLHSKIGSDLFEDRRYWYELRVDDPSVRGFLLTDGKVLRPSPKDESVGILDTKSQAGFITLFVRLVRGADEETRTVSFEILPAKFDPISFRAMLDDVCGQMLGLVLRLNSMSRIPLRVASRIEVSTIQQRFFFLQYLLGGDEFQHALDQITKAPHTRVEMERASRSRLTSGRLGRNVNIVLARGTNRVPIPGEHPLSALGSIPKSGIVLRSAETVDTPENRFVKFALEQFLGHLKIVESACADSDVVATRRVAEECARLERDLRRVLEHSLFKEIGPSSFLPLGSPVLQRRSGYREVLNAWLKFHLAASLYWEGSEDVFGAGKRDTDKLYEYWLFFQFLTLLGSEFGVPLPSADRFLSESEDGLLFKLKAGRNFVHHGTVLAGRRKLRLRFSYNRTFSKSTASDAEGSWTLTMRPDFTLTFWPHCVDENIAEALHLTVHLHFDCKYRLENVPSLFDESEDVGFLKDSERTGNYKRGDLFVAHTYRDAIRRSAGAYIIYPGSEHTPTLRQQYHEILPGLGAFPVRPRLGGAVGIERIGDLLREVVTHLGDYDSARERVSYETWKAYRNKSSSSVPWPARAEVSGANRIAPAYGEILIAPALACFPADWIREYKVLPLRMTNEIAARLISSSVLTTCMAVVVYEPSSGFRLVRFDRNSVQFTDGSAISSAVGDVPGGVYAMLPLDFESSVQVFEQNSNSMDQLASVAGSEGTPTVTLEVFTTYMTFPGN